MVDDRFVCGKVVMAIVMGGVLGVYIVIFDVVSESSFFDLFQRTKIIGIPKATRRKLDLTMNGGIESFRLGKTRLPI